MHIHNSANSEFPNCNLLEFYSFSKRCELQDKNVTVAVIDREFIAVNYEIDKDEQDNNPDR